MASLYFYYSTMNAGKSTLLLQTDYNYRERGMRTLIFSPSFDMRSGAARVASRIGLRSSAIPFEKGFDFFTFCEKMKKDGKIDCVLVDEAQFLTKDQVWQLTHVVDELDMPVLTYGLRTDFVGQLFEGSAALLAWAEHLIELKAVCFCGRKTTMTARVMPNGLAACRGDQIEIGGNDKYQNFCRKHYKELIMRSHQRTAVCEV